MRTKLLLTAAAVLTAGVVASSAQVYSANVVGYYNVPIPANQYVLAGNQLVNSTSNDLNTIIGTTLPNKSSVITWNGTGYTTSLKGGTGWSPDQTLAEGQGFYVITPASAGTLTNTFIGSVVVGPGASVTNTLAGSTYALVASPIPYATDLNDTNNTLNLSTLPNKTSVITWNGSGYTTSLKGGTGWSPDQNISVGEGFYVYPPAAGATWIQTLPSQ